MNRVMSFIVGSAAALLASNATPATAITINLNDKQYNVTTIEGYYNSVESKLKSTPWWSSQALATEAAQQVGLSFELPNDSEGPYFAYNSFPDLGNGPSSMTWWTGTQGVTEDETYPKDSSYHTMTWAYAAAVPFEYDGMVLPIATFGFLLALGVKRKLDTRKSIAYPPIIVNQVDSQVILRKGIN